MTEQTDRNTVYTFEPTEQDRINVAKDHILRLVKKQNNHRSFAEPLLCLVDSHDGRPVPADLRVVWQYYAGMGECDLKGLAGAEKQAALNLVNDGMLVPTTSSPFYNYKLKLLSHFDDVRWGKKEDGRFVIFNLARNGEHPDEVIETDESHAPARKKLQHLLDNKTAAEDSGPIMLVIKNEKKIEVVPIHTDPELVALRQRQLAFWGQEP